MNIVLVRIDDRFIHGQILEAWIPYLDAQAVIVANDCLASDDFQKAIMAMAIPDRIFFQIISINEAPKLQVDPLLKDKFCSLLPQSRMPMKYIKRCPLIGLISGI